MKNTLAVLSVVLVALTTPPATAAEPDYSRTPILMVHGYFPSNAADWVTWGTFRNKLIDEGWPEEYVYAPQFADTTGCDPDHAREISVWVDELRASTGFDRIDIVAHSEGGLNTMYYLRYFCGVNKVEDFVGLAVAVHGTRVACVDFVSCGADEMCIPTADNGGWQANPVLAAVNECDETLGDIRYTSIWSETDEIIVPQSGSMLHGANNIELDGIVGHGTIFLFDQPFSYLKDALLNHTGLNTDGPGWDCIDYCVPPDPADDVVPPESAEIVEAATADDAPDATADAVQDVSQSEAAPDAAGPDGTDAPDTVVLPDGNQDGTGPARDAVPSVDGLSDSSVRDAAADSTGDTGATSATGGCSAGRGGAAPVAAILAFFAVLCVLGRRRARTRRNGA